MVTNNSWNSQNPAQVAKGGTGVATMTTAYAPVCAGTTATGALQVASTGLGTVNYVLTSNGSGALPSFQDASASGATTTFDGDTGSATPSSGVITFDANTNCGSSVDFSATGSTVSLNVTDSNDNTIIGKGSGNGSISGQNNNAFGFGTLSNLTSGDSNFAAGLDCLTLLTTGDANCGLGTGSLDQLTTGSYNCCLGENSGQNYTSSESSNVLINHPGTAAESNVLRIGSGTGTGDQDLNKAFIAGINGNTSSNPLFVTINSSTDQLGTVTTGPQISSSGAITNSAQPLFVAYLSSSLTDVTGDGTIYTIAYDSTSVNQGTVFDTGTYTFTAPVTGNYLFTGTAVVENLGATHTQMNYLLYKNASVQYYVVSCNPYAMANTDGSNYAFTYSIVIPLTAADTVIVLIYVATTSKTVGLGGGANNPAICTFSGFLLC